MNAKTGKRWDNQNYKIKKEKGEDEEGESGFKTQIVPALAARDITYWRVKKM